MKTLIYSIIFTSIFFLIIDILWLSYSVKTFYRPNLGSLLNDKPVFWAAILFYLIYIFGVAVLVLNPSINNDSLYQAFFLGSVLGLVAYGTYNLTNMATVKDWSAVVVLVDMLWGGFLTGFSSTLGIYIAKKFFI